MTAESIVPFPSKLSMVLSHPKRAHSTSTWQSFPSCFAIQVTMLIFWKEETRRGTRHENIGLHSGVTSKPLFALALVPILWYASTNQDIDLEQCHMTTTTQILPSVPDVGVTCHHLLERGQVHPKGLISSQVVCPHYTKLLMPFPMNPSQSCCHHPYMADRIRVYFVTAGILKRRWTALEISCAFERDRAAQPFCGVRNITCWRLVLYFLFANQLLAGQGQGLEEDWAAACMPHFLWPHGASEGNISEGWHVWRKQWHFQSLTHTVSITVLLSNIWLLQFSSARLHNMYCQ